MHLELSPGSVSHVFLSPPPPSPQFRPLSLCHWAVAAADVLGGHHSPGGCQVRQPGVAPSSRPPSLTSYQCSSSSFLVSTSHTGAPAPPMLVHPFFKQKPEAPPNGCELSRLPSSRSLRCRFRDFVSRSLWTPLSPLAAPVPPHALDTIRASVFMQDSLEKSETNIFSAPVAVSCGVSSIEPVCEPHLRILR